MDDEMQLLWTNGGDASASELGPSSMLAYLVLSHLIVTCQYLSFSHFILHPPSHAHL